MSAKTRAWDKAEKFKRAEDDRRDPAIKRLWEIEEQEAHKLTLQQGKDITVLDAKKRWVASQKAETDLTVGIYERAARPIQEWAADRQIERFNAVHEAGHATMVMLDLRDRGVGADSDPRGFFQ